MNGTNSNHAPSLIEKKPKKQPFVNGFGAHLNELADTMKPPGVVTPGMATDPAPETDYAAMLSAAEVRVTDSIEASPVCLSVQHGDEQFVIGTLGNFGLVIGKAKSRKTTGVSIAIAALVKEGIALNKIRGSLPADRPILLYFDTEQSRFHVQRTIKRICTLCGIPEPANLKTYSLRSLSTVERLELIRWAIYHTPGVGLVIIDGIRDLVYDPNDAETAAHCANNLLKWTEELQIHILTVLHQNKADTNARGHLGTELVNKAETVISVSRDPENRDVSVMAPEYCRDKDFEPFAFSIDESGLPYLLDDHPIGSTNNRNTRKPTADELSSDQVDSILLRAFTGTSQLSYADLLTNLVEASQHSGWSLSQMKARELIQRILLENKLEKFRPDKARWDYYRPLN